MSSPGRFDEDDSEADLLGSEGDEEPQVQGLKGCQRSPHPRSPRTYGSSAPSLISTLASLSSSSDLSGEDNHRLAAAIGPIL